jgi:hypothetical protein
LGLASLAPALLRRVGLAPLASLASVVTVSRHQ